MAIAQTELTKEQIKGILSAKGLTGATLETTTAELAQITAINQTAAAQAGATVSTNVFSASLKKLGLALKGLVASHPVLMLMYGKEASNRKQEIDRQHHTIPNQRSQRPKDKHCGNVHNRLWNHG